MIDSNWKRSTRCDNSGPNCVEVKLAADDVQIRDSKLGDASPVLTFSAEEFRGVVQDIKDKGFYTYAENMAVVHVNDVWSVYSRHDAGPEYAQLVFVEDEWASFVAGAKAGDFDL